MLDTIIRFLMSVGVVCTLIVGIIKWIKTYDWSSLKPIDDLEIVEIEQALNSIVDKSIEIVNETFVNKLKSQIQWDNVDGRFDMSIYQLNANIANQKCVDTINSMVPKKTKKRLKMTFGDLNEYWISRIESRLTDKS
ncbi:MAG: hypothetical protein FWF56_06475 [Firmicutes bacterium]|nr:hypothetical protein [Bacillota bacterium]MCL1953197.1 hypothetical protein [Bacillota bacterium]